MPYTKADFAQLKIWKEKGVLSSQTNPLPPSPHTTPIIPIQPLTGLDRMRTKLEKLTEIKLMMNLLQDKPDESQTKNQFEIFTMFTKELKEARQQIKEELQDTLGQEEYDPETEVQIKALDIVENFLEQNPDILKKGGVQNEPNPTVNPGSQSFAVTALTEPGAVKDKPTKDI